MSIQLLLGGARYAGLLRATIMSTNYFSCDSFSITVASGSSPAFSLASLIKQVAGVVELVGVSPATGDTVPLITGRIDRIACDPVLGTLYAEGRDLSAVLIDSYLQQDFVNQTASEVVANLAVQAELLPVITPTAGFVGRYFEDGFSRLSLGDFSRFRSNWDLIVELAREQDFDVYVSGRTLYFGPSALSAEKPTQLSLPDVLGLTFEQDVSLLTSPTVNVQTWDTQQISSYKGAAAADPMSPLATSVKGNAPYLFSYPNLTAVQADARAAMYSREIARFGTGVRVEMPLDFRIAPRSILSLSGSATPFDGLYTVDHVERRFSSSTGSTQSVGGRSWVP